MQLVDTSVWIDHLHRADAALIRALERGLVLAHPMVRGELALGSIKQRATVIDMIGKLPQARTATHDEVLTLVERHSLHGRGLALVDVHLLAATLLTPGSALWTRDKWLRRAAGDVGAPVS